MTADQTIALITLVLVAALWFGHRAAERAECDRQTRLALKRALARLEKAASEESES